MNESFYDLCSISVDDYFRNDLMHSMTEQHRPIDVRE